MVNQRAKRTVWPRRAAVCVAMAMLLLRQNHFVVALAMPLVGALVMFDIGLFAYSRWSRDGRESNVSNS
jgi:hypothetical protein